MKGHFRASPLCKGPSLPQHRGQLCRGRSRGRGYGRGRGTDRPPQRHDRVHYPDCQEPDPDVCDIFDQSIVQQCYTAFMEESFASIHISSADNDWTVTFEIQGSQYPLELEIDSGARCSIISKAIAQRFTSIASVCESGTVTNGVCGNPTKVHGEITLPCKYGTVLRNITFRILDTPKQISLLGRSDCLRFGGGPPSNELSALAKTVQMVIGETNAIITGIDGGIDSSVLHLITDDNVW